MGIEIVNNKSKIVDNFIEKQHEEAIKIVGDNKSTRSTPEIWRNFVISCGSNGILCLGSQCEPDIRGNVIMHNRKAGIKLTENAIAHIGGTSKVDIKFIPSVNRQASNNTFQTAKVAAIKNLCSSFDSDQAKEMVNISLNSNIETLAGAGNQKMNVKSFPNPNVISQNFNQGILIVEGSSAKIVANKIDSNIKANIALGGQKSGKTKIKYNYIENSKSEGIFIIEGEERFIIEDNQIVGNNDGVVFVDSKGLVVNNNIKANQRSGILTAGETFVIIDSNFIEENLAAGILIKDPSLPEMRRNEICKNFF